MKFVIRIIFLDYRIVGFTTLLAYRMVAQSVGTYLQPFFFVYFDSGVERIKKRRSMMLELIAFLPPRCPHLFHDDGLGQINFNERAQPESRYTVSHLCKGHAARSADAGRSYTPSYRLLYHGK